MKITLSNLRLAIVIAALQWKQTHWGAMKDIAFLRVINAMSDILTKLKADIKAGSICETTAKVTDQLLWHKVSPAELSSEEEDTALAEHVDHEYRHFLVGKRRQEEQARIVELETGWKRRIGRDIDVD